MDHLSCTRNFKVVVKLKPDFRPEPGIPTVPKLCLYQIFRIFSYSSNIRSFIYSLVLFIMYGYITNSQNDQLPDGLITELVEHCNGFESRAGLTFFRL